MMPSVDENGLWGSNPPQGKKSPGWLFDQQALLA
jgi:hypothetical protein